MSAVDRPVFYPVAVLTRRRVLFWAVLMLGLTGPRLFSAEPRAGEGNADGDETEDVTVLAPFNVKGSTNVVRVHEIR